MNTAKDFGVMLHALVDELSYMFQDGFENIFQVVVNFVVGKTEKPNAESRKVCLPFMVVKLRVPNGVSITVNFDGEFEVWAIKIQGVWANTKLPSKLDPG